MENNFDKMKNRRLFLRFMTCSPFFALGPKMCKAEKGRAPSSLNRSQRVHKEAPDRANQIISSSGEATNVLDFKAAAQKQLPPAHYGYIATGVDDDATLVANREAFSHIQIRVRRLIDISEIDMTTELFGVKMENPIMLAPVGSQRTFHPNGELETAKAAKSRKHHLILSTVASTSIEDVTAARGAPVWFQLYAAAKWQDTQTMLKRAEASGCSVVVLTVEMLAGSNRETQRHFNKKDNRACNSCHVIPGMKGFIEGKPMIKELPMIDSRDFSFSGPLTWEFVRKLKNSTSMKVVLKGIVTSEDAELCVKYGVDGIIISNHGGRAEESGRATIDCLPEIVSAVKGRIPVIVDGGFRRGTDVFKALALGARAICIGRPYIWGLAAFGQSGVESVLDLLRAELHLVMKQAGTTALDQINKNFILKASRRG
jgi:4-hydroxymandelate oxidase